MSDQRWLVWWKQIVRNVIIKISLTIDNTTNNNEKDIDNTLSTLSNSKMPNQKSSNAPWLQHMESQIYVKYAILMCEIRIPPRLFIFIKTPYLCPRNKSVLYIHHMYKQSIFICMWFNWILNMCIRAIFIFGPHL